MTNINEKNWSQLAQNRFNIARLTVSDHLWKSASPPIDMTFSFFQCKKS